MREKIRQGTRSLLRKSEQYTKTDMVYLAKGGFWLLLQQVVAVGTSFVLSVAFANLASKEAFGTYKFIISVAGILGALSLTGIGTAVTRSVARGFEGMLKEAFLLNLKWSVLSVISFFGLALYYLAYGNMVLAVSLIIAGIFSPLLQSSLFYKPYLQGKKEFQADGIISSLRILLPFFLLIGTLFLFPEHPLLFIFIYFTSNTCAAFAAYTFVARKIPPGSPSDSGMLRYSSHLSFMDFFGTLGNQLDNILVFHYLGAAQVATYYFATAIPDQISSIFRNIGTLAFPKFSAKTPKEMQQGIYVKGAIIFAITLIAAILYVLVAPYLFTFFFPKYHESIFLSQVAIFLVLAVTSILPSTGLSAGKAIKELHLLVISGTVINIILLFVLIPRYGMLGGVLATLITKLYKGIFTYILFNTFVKRSSTLKIS